MKTETPDRADVTSAPVEASAPLTRMPLKTLLAISAYWFATNLHWGTLLLIMIPSQIKQIAPEHRGEAEGLVVGIGAVVALIVPLLIGALSDRCASRWGRRRPYMIAGVSINVLGL